MKVKIDEKVGGGKIGLRSRARLGAESARGGRGMKAGRDKRKIVAAGMLVAAAAAGGAYVASQPVSAEEAPANANTNTTSEESTNAKDSRRGTSEDGSASGKRERKELSEEKKAEIRERLENMSEEEKQEWLESHKGMKGDGGGKREDGKGPGKPEGMSDEEWEAKKAERKAKHRKGAKTEASEDS